MTIAGNPYDVRYACTCSSPPALLALYGLRGRSGSPSTLSPLLTSPYTSSVLTCTKRSCPCSRAASMSTKVP